MGLRGRWKMRGQDTATRRAGAERGSRWKASVQATRSRSGPDAVWDGNAGQHLARVPVYEKCGTL